MNGIVPLIVKPCRQRRRQRHVDQESHSAGSAASGTVSSSARKTAYRKASSMSAASRYGYAFNMASRVSPAASRPSDRKPQPANAGLAGTNGGVDHYARKGHGRRGYRSFADTSISGRETTERTEARSATENLVGDAGIEPATR